VKGIAAQPISTARLVLRPLRVDDSAELSQALDDPALHLFIGGSPLDPEQLRERYERLVAGAPDPDQVWLNWAIQQRADASLVGTVQATLTRAGSDWAAEVAWVVGTAWQGQGLAREAALALVTWLADQPVRRVVAHVHPDHRASAAVAWATGLRPTDRMHDGEVRWELNPAHPAHLA
jgi:RimJ/RimL family protein N-acetyltransferase